MAWPPPEPPWCSSAATPKKPMPDLRKSPPPAAKPALSPPRPPRRDDLARLRDDVLANEGSIDILVNGAGINSPTPFLEISDEEFQRILEVNLAGVFRACQILGGQMLTQPNGGSIINLGSISGLGPLSRVFTYSASKAAVHNLSKNLAREWAPKASA